MPVLAQHFTLKDQPLSSKTHENLSDYSVMLISFDFTNRDKVVRFRNFCKETKSDRIPKIFVAGEAGVSASSATQAFKAGQTISKPIDIRELLATIGRIFPDMAGEIEAKPASSQETSKKCFATLSTITKMVQSGNRLSRKHVEGNARDICKTIGHGTTIDWLAAVNDHHSYTFRHSLHVAGLTYAFAEHLGFNERDKNTMVTGALLHDVGKAKIPLALLDKEAPLTLKEQMLFVQHPTFGGQILKNDGCWDQLTLNLVLEHHEYLDGSGFPKRLAGDGIIDPVRMLTIADVFSEQVDKRSYKDALEPKKAMKKLFSMAGKLDMDMVKAFEPVGLKVIEDLKTAVPAG